jgi:hypothetical protein
MSHTPASEHASGALLGEFHPHTRLPTVLLTLAVLCIALAPVTIWLGSRPDSDSPALRYLLGGLLATLGALLLGAGAWQWRLLGSHFEVYDQGIVAIDGGQRRYLRFADLEDLYVFSPAGAAGQVTHLAWRTGASQPWQLANVALKQFTQFQQLVRELHVRAQLPRVFASLQAGRGVAFRYLSDAQVRSPRQRRPLPQQPPQVMTLSVASLEFQGRRISMRSLSRVDLGSWREHVLIKDASGKPVLSTPCTGIFSHDLFLHTLEAALAFNSAAEAMPRAVSQ